MNKKELLKKLLQTFFPTDNHYNIFWLWFLKGKLTNQNKTSEDKFISITPGYKKIYNKWILFHLLIGLFITFFSKETVERSSMTIMLPLSSALIGITFAWAGNISSILLEPHLKHRIQIRKSKIDDYVFTFQLAALVILTTLCLWGLAGIGVHPSSDLPFLSSLFKIFLFSMISLSLREGWHVIYGVSALTIVRGQIPDIKKKSSSSLRERTILHNKNFFN